MRFSQVYRLHNTAWSVNERRYKQRPTSDDVKETEILLTDMGIKTPIPNFDTLAELLRFRKSEILKLLSVAPLSNDNRQIALSIIMNHTKTRYAEYFND